jgi:chaperonin GroES
MPIRPLHDHVVVRRLDGSTTSSGGIVIPDSASKKPNQGEVLAVGPGALLENGERRPLDVKPGDRVLFRDYAPNEVKVDGEELLVIRENDILGIIEEQAQKVEKAA